MDRTRTIAIAVLALSSVAPVAAAGTPFVDEVYTYSRTSNVQYGSNVIGDGTTIPLLLDVYQPTGPNVPAELPGVVIMHGGYFQSGTKTQFDATGLASLFASRGYVAVSIDYRLQYQRPPRPGDPVYYEASRLPVWLSQDPDYLQWYTDTVAAAVEDQAMAVNWFIDHAGQFNVNPKMIAAGGWSAGAVSSLALAAGVVDGAHADVGAVFSLAGGLFGSEVFLGPDAAPAFMVHGTRDTTVPFAELGFMTGAYEAAGVPYVGIEAPGVAHDVAQLLAAGGQERMLTFLIEQLRAHAVPEPSTHVLAAIGTLALLYARVPQARQRRARPRQARRG